MALTLSACSGHQTFDDGSDALGGKRSHSTGENDKVDGGQELPDESTSTLMADASLSPAPTGSDAGALPAVSESFTADTETLSEVTTDMSSRNEPNTSAFETSVPSETSTPNDPTSPGDTTEASPVFVDPNNLLSNASFEDGVGDWVGLTTSTVAVSTETANTGERSLQSLGRTQSWEGPSLDVTALVQPGQQYVASAWVRTASEGQPFHIVRKAICAGDAGADGNGQGYIYAQLASTYAYGTWSQIVAAPFTVPDCELSSFAIHVEGPAPGATFFLDDVSLSVAP